MECTRCAQSEEFTKVLHGTRSFFCSTSRTHTRIPLLWDDVTLGVTTVLLDALRKASPQVVSASNRVVLDKRCMNICSEARLWHFSNGIHGGPWVVKEDRLVCGQAESWSAI